MNRTGTRIGLSFGLAAVVLAGCGADGRRTATGDPSATSAPTRSTTSTPSSMRPTPTSTVARTTSTTAATVMTTAPPATASVTTPTTAASTPGVGVSPVTAAELGGSWHAGCPVGPAQLRRLTLSYWGFDGQSHRGQMVVNAQAVTAIGSVITRLYVAHFPIRKMITIDHYAGTGVQLDDESTADDNTAAFNCRNAVNPGGPPAWSEHAYGEAVDVNPVENPYVEANGVVDPPNGAPFVNRGIHRAGMAYAGSPLNAAFAAVGWSWGGNWSGNPDYQHFSVNGQ